jgi:hypothetical protein
MVEGLGSVMLGLGSHPPGGRRADVGWAGRAEFGDTTSEGPRGDGWCVLLRLTALCSKGSFGLNFVDKAVQAAIARG